MERGRLSDGGFSGVPSGIRGCRLGNAMSSESRDVEWSAALVFKPPLFKPRRQGDCHPR